MKKRIQLMLLSCLLGATLIFPAQAFTDDADISTFAIDAVNTLSDLGIISGFADGSFQPAGSVTRAEMAKMIYVVRNNSFIDSVYTELPTTFTDLGSAEWAKGYIKFCESQGIIAGKSATTFAPNAKVTGVEAAKMLLVLAGYDPDKAGLTGLNWRTNTMKWGGLANLFENIMSALEDPLPRQYAAQMIYNALDVTRVKWSDTTNSFEEILNGGVKETVGMSYMGLSGPIKDNSWKEDDESGDAQQDEQTDDFSQSESSDETWQDEEDSSSWEDETSDETWQDEEDDSSWEDETLDESWQSEEDDGSWEDETSYES